MHIVKWTLATIWLFQVASVAAAAPLVFTKGPSGIIAGGPPGSGLISVANARLTRPGVDDIVVAMGVTPPNPIAKIPQVLLAPQPDGTVVNISLSAFKPSPPALTMSGTVVFGDLNRDGKLDIFFAANGYDASPFTGETNALLLSQPDGTFRDESALLPKAPDFTNSATIGDVNGDGNLDIFVGNIYNPAMVGPYLLLGNGGTAFAQSSALPSRVITLLDTYTGSILVDVDHDGYLDLVLGTNGGDAAKKSLILFNDGTGDFSKRAPGTLPSGLFGATNTLNLSFAIVDINMDGYADLLVSQTQRVPYYVGHAIQVLVNDRLGGYVDQTSTYIPGSVALSGPWKHHIKVLDLNGDGIPDFYMQGIFGRNPAVPVTFGWVSDGLGRWVPVDDTVVGNTFTQFIVFTDIDGDGLPDYIVFTGFSPDDINSGNIHYQTYFNVTPKPATKIAPAIEYYYAAWDFYFETAFPDEIAALDGGAFGGAWKRTGQTFNVWPQATGPASATCRFFSTAFAPKSSHFYTPFPTECAIVKTESAWQYEAIAFYIQLADADGFCPIGTIPLYRLYNNGMGGAPNHRYTTSVTVFNQMAAAGWLFEGNGNTKVFACVPQ
jgi:hypothetical protein